MEGSEPVVEALGAALGAGLLGVQTDRGETTLVVDRGSIREACRLLRDGAEKFAHLSFICGVDYLDMGLEPRYAVVYQLYSPSARRQLRLKVPVEATDPVVPSVVGVFTAAGWHERETFDMYGIQFEGHPNLTRILMPEDADFFPLRKDVPLGGEEIQFTHTEAPIHLPHRPKED